MTNEEMLEILRCEVESDEPEFLKKRITEMADAIGQLVRERDALLADLRELNCEFCEHKSVLPDDEPCKSCRILFGFEEKWEWRGVQDE